MAVLFLVLLFQYIDDSDFPDLLINSVIFMEERRLGRAKDIDQLLEENVDILFLCNSVYWNGIDGKVKAFLKASGHKIGMLVNISSAALKESTYKKMKSFAMEAGIPIDEREFHCKGSFMGMHKGKPDQSDIENVKKFARELTK